MGAAAAAKPALTVLLSLATARAACEGLYDLTGTRGLQTAAGVVAILLEDTRGHRVLPTGRRRRARESLEGGLGAQLASLESEAGVRNQPWARARWREPGGLVLNKVRPACPLRLTPRRL